jgi:hypothetical protein
MRIATNNRMSKKAAVFFVQKVKTRTRAGLTGLRRGWLRLGGYSRQLVVT